ncbi:sensor histidine kinase [Corynebacterium uberis]|uniref:sensor histidine kinase n=1 Tax=Corynebacterium TaxID=1716 RepID=UPI001D0BAFC6|nr:histidine kinase [Corynebacterium uberis]MCZ9310312.1 histidine kinase [Corynebacterium sp. c6VSa_13]UDL73340.1 histidine kinase [Corynebacterium uberis]UDL75782.1 histidine kinase [Corynebacterium uberis]UDL77994.1 histidine kinase [Corynebacterium uberis]UDL80277.1 histidine kinase [Corynebacterium uberis]
MIKSVIQAFRAVPMEVWVFLSCTTMTIVWMIMTDPDSLRVDRMLWTIVLALSVAAIKRFPLSGFLTFVVLFGSTIVIAELFMSPFVFFCAMAIAMVGYSGRIALMLPAGLLVTVMGLVDRKNLTVETSLPVVFPWMMLMIVAGAAGWALGRKVRQKAELSAQWQRDYRERREELARTLHDSVAASLTSIVMRSEMLALSHAGEGELEEELSGIAEAGRTTMSQVRSLLGLLNAPQENPEGPKAPSLHESLNKAAEKLRSNGFEALVQDEADALTLTHPVLEILGRVIAECSLNAIKYAQPGSQVTLWAGGTGGAVTVKICNQIADAEYRTRPTAKVLSSGLGMEMMRKSISSIGGKLKTETDGRVWTVTAQLAE